MQHNNFIKIFSLTISQKSIHAKFVDFYERVETPWLFVIEFVYNWSEFLIHMCILKVDHDVSWFIYLLNLTIYINLISDI